MNGWLAALWVYLVMLFTVGGLWMLRRRERDDDTDDDFE